MQGAGATPANVTDRAHRPARIIVSDNGKGIAGENLSKAGQRGFSFGKANGNGLGLSHARSFVEAAGGKLTIQSRVGLGTMVTLSLPIVTASPVN